MYSLHNIDCLEHMHSMPAQSVDAILTDLPYGTTACAWDVVIPFEPMWEAVKHVLKPDGAFVTTASQPFTSLLVCSNLEMFKYEWSWDKKITSMFQNANKMPMKAHENILVFSRGCIYNPQKVARTPEELKRLAYKSYSFNGDKSQFVSGKTPWKLRGRENSLYKSPSSVIRINGMCNRSNRIHPTQKPVALYKYLVQTYTNPGDTVLDMCMGSGTTGEACIETGRDFIGCETEEEHFLTAQQRLDRVSRQGQLFSAASSANKGVNADKTRAEQLSIL